MAPCLSVETPMHNPLDCSARTLLYALLGNITSQPLCMRVQCCQLPDTARAQRKSSNSSSWAVRHESAHNSVHSAVCNKRGTRIAYSSNLCVYAPQEPLLGLHVWRAMTLPCYACWQ
jgi:hypothetical protein